MTRSIRERKQAPESPSASAAGENMTPFFARLESSKRAKEQRPDPARMKRREVVDASSPSSRLPNDVFRVARRDEPSDSAGNTQNLVNFFTSGRTYTITVVAVGAALVFQVAVGISGGITDGSGMGKNVLTSAHNKISTSDISPQLSTSFAYRSVYGRGR